MYHSAYTQNMILLRYRLFVNIYFNIFFIFSSLSYKYCKSRAFVQNQPQNEMLPVSHIASDEANRNVGATPCGCPNMLYLAPQFIAGSSLIKQFSNL
jgi:hypothetical protein